MPTDLNQPLADGNYGGVSFFNQISIQEIAGREGTDSAGSSTATRTWLLRGSSDPLACRDALVDGPVLINEYDDLFIDQISRERIGPDSWNFTANYSTSTPPVGSTTVSIDTTGATVLQSYAINQASFPAPGETAVDYGTAIDVQDGAPKGVQRVIPALKINVRSKIAKNYISSPVAYAKLVSRHTGWLNSTPMFDGEFAAGELLFMGATGEVIAKEPLLTFVFIASENVDALQVGNIMDIPKAGHDYLWLDHRESKDPNTKTKSVVLRAAYTSEIYGRRDLNVLRIGEV